MTSSLKDPRHWHIRAVEIRAIAEEIHNLEIREEMLRVATDYDKLALRAEERSISLQREPELRE